ncbi:uncharacterized protein METZ01_LOCUS33618 [marine metagenome]|uniref:Uncharacterized protein n=1 Tax=marine metagenome TaxID=408172 RepID=A0A381QP87_9ZZZZ
MQSVSKRFTSQAIQGHRPTKKSQRRPSEQKLQSHGSVLLILLKHFRHFEEEDTNWSLLKQRSRPSTSSSGNHLFRFVCCLATKLKGQVLHYSIFVRHMYRSPCWDENGH